VKVSVDFGDAKWRARKCLQQSRQAFGKELTVGTIRSPKVKKHELTLVVRDQLIELGWRGADDPRRLSIFQNTRLLAFAGGGGTTPTSLGQQNLRTTWAPLRVRTCTGNRHSQGHGRGSHW